MANINKITIDGTTYDIEDTTARASTGVTDDIKVALLNCFQNVAWINADGQDYYDALESALYPPTNLSSISAVYTQSGTVYEETSTLSDLRTNLIVTANYSDNTSETINTYSLSGTLTLGTSTITVSYGGKTTTFNVTVTTSADYYWDFTNSLTDIVGNVTATLSDCSFTQGTGVLFNNDNAYIDLGSNRFGLNKTIIIDIVDATASFGNVNGILLEFADANTHDYPYKVDTTVTYDGRVCFGYHYSSTAANNRFGVISKSVGHWGYSSSSTKTAFDGSHELKLTVDANGLITVYKDGEDINVLYNNAQTYATVDYLLYTVIGSISYYPTFYNATIQRARIYSGVI